MTGFLQLRLPRLARSALTRGAAIGPALAATLAAGEAGSERLILLCSVVLSFQACISHYTLVEFHAAHCAPILVPDFLSEPRLLPCFQLPFALIPLLKFASCERLMAPHALAPRAAACMWVLTGAVVAANVYLMLHITSGTAAIDRSARGGTLGALAVLGGLGYLGALVALVRKPVTQPRGGAEGEAEGGAEGEAERLLAIPDEEPAGIQPQGPADCQNEAGDEGAAAPAGVAGGGGTPALLL